MNSYEALLDEYELTIAELEAQIAATSSNEYKQRLANVKCYRHKLSSLASWGSIYVKIRWTESKKKKS